ncbi:hypothetical protein BDN70DRAFT_626215 [Pholiota conissans]|uniref:Uncharacterized protein n=1 Tax=Pholiota conissans TaxID=109636 RepID=A0A9P6CLP0_9AGAR|nr:hypothetical protein BDN70DRAFT_626215 [Pholiota conissans]
MEGIFVNFVYLLPSLGQSSSAPGSPTPRTMGLHASTLAEGVLFLMMLGREFGLQMSILLQDEARWCSYVN